ncbi:hypothetical protein JAAARDRAFT_280844 [Jaapia argillacea MUCL 33604]|uniref:F-box domain-containing protein n=1 Tax=Jaapia argillacea MUCL 33604 TaxID=933084 RepID=A0A067PQC8_9AGAM|nr:hypothetical protein JAAARDRAFT_280844 [Jaapia argillacea MUCL 33604]
MSAFLVPSELIEDILTESWQYSNWRASPGRWHFYKTVLLVSHEWSAIMMNISLHHIILDTARDLTNYHHLYKALEARTSTEEFPSLRKKMFETAHLRLILHRNEFDVCTRSLEEVDRLIPDSQFIEVATLQGSRDSLDVLTMLSHYPSLTDLRICYRSDRYIYHNPSPPSMPTVTHLHLIRSPRNLSAVLVFFPNVTSLRLSTPHFLKNLATTTDKLVLLTIDAPPNHAIAGVKGSSSIRGFGISSALRNGFLQARVSPESGDYSENVVKKEIFVYTGWQTPDGWEAAVESCQLYGVRLERICTYMNSLPVTTSEVYKDWVVGSWL